MQELHHVMLVFTKSASTSVVLGDSSCDHRPPPCFTFNNTEWLRGDGVSVQPLALSGHVVTQINKLVFPMSARLSSSGSRSTSPSRSRNFLKDAIWG